MTALACRAGKGDDRHGMGAMPVMQDRLCGKRHEPTNLSLPFTVRLTRTTANGDMVRAKATNRSFQNKTRILLP